MLFVRNPTGRLALPGRVRRPTTTARAGVAALAAVLEELACEPVRRRRYWARARLAGRRRRRRTCCIEVDGRPVHRGRRPASAPPPARPRLPGLTCPGLPTPTRTPSTGRCAGAPTPAAARSGPGGSGCTRVAGRLDPDTYLALARAVYAEMALAGITCVGEFHYLHHGPAARRTPTRTRWATRCSPPRAEAGIRITLLDTLLPDGSTVDRRTPLDRAAAAVRRRRRRRAGPPGSPRSRPAPHARIGAAVHSVRAVPARRAADASPTAAGRPPAARAPVRAAAENEACLAALRPHADRSCSPTPALLGPRPTAVHATHLTDDGHRPLLGDTRHRGLLVPDHRARPGRRHRPGPGAGRRRRRRCPSAPTATPSSTCSRRPARSSCDERLRDRAARATSAPASCCARPPSPGTPRSAGPTPARIAVGRPGRPGHGAAGLGPHRRLDPADRRAVVFAATAADVRHRGGRRPAGRPRRPAPARRRRRRRWPPRSPRRGRDRGAAVAMSLLITNIGELVTNDPTLGDGRRSGCCTTPRW